MRIWSGEAVGLVQGSFTQKLTKQLWRRLWPYQKGTRWLQEGWSHKGFHQVFLFQWGIKTIKKGIITAWLISWSKEVMIHGNNSIVTMVSDRDTLSETALTKELWKIFLPNNNLIQYHVPTLYILAELTLCPTWPLCRWLRSCVCRPATHTQRSLNMGS